MKHFNDLAFLRQLCCLGLGKEIVMPEFLKAVAQIIPSSNNLFIGISENGEPDYFLGESFISNPQEIATTFSTRFFNKENLQGIAELGCGSVITDHQVLDNLFSQSEFYRMMWEPYKRHHFILAPIFTNNRLAGMLLLFRPQEELPFSACEIELCKQLSPYVAHALQKCKYIGVNYVMKGQPGLIVSDNQGNILNVSATAKSLLKLVTQSDFNPFHEQHNPILPPEIIDLCRNLNMLFKGGDAPAPVFIRANDFGRFIFRAYWLDPLNNEPNGLIGILIEHQESVELNIAGNMQAPSYATKKSNPLNAGFWLHRWKNRLTALQQANLSIKDITEKFI